MNAIRIGSVAGHHFHGRAELEVVYHCKRGADTGFYHVRKRIANWDAYEYDHTLGWEIDRWFEWEAAESLLTTGG
jgi:hypothetical protein